MNTSSKSLNKYLSENCSCSRREADKWIEAGRVMLNGVLAKKGNRVVEGDRVLLDGQNIVHRLKPIYLMFNKPPGITCTTDLSDPDNIIDFIGFPQRIFPIGRLDKPSTGLILLTNDGDIVNEILRVEHGHEKEYVVKVNQEVTRDFIQKMERGIPILGTITEPCTLKKINNKIFSITLTQGLNRQIRRMCEYLGYRVVSLKRIRIMHLELGHLPLGQLRELNPEELDVLLSSTKERANN
ncbi:MAG: pseudouridine synthase [Saprospiraceae bacterium]